MNVYIALFRGINVGGKNILSMKALIGILDELGFVEINTYIQSGNVIFRSSKKCSSSTATQVGKKIMAQHGFKPKVLLLGETELRLAVKNNPFNTDEAKALHFYFLDAIPESPDLAKLEGLKSDSEEFALFGTVFYLYAPDGIGRSRLAAVVEKNMGVAATARNWNTVNKLISMVGA
ncbi:MAG: DUF1697 domain-containing protein [bacterium]|nr:DUF1697 domain-containing protein [Gammaproteobacteria bacterium]HIL98910.1 DUF1697 domain-containing protein [Pseudomonadales bacterium]